MSRKPHAGRGTALVMPFFLLVVAYLIGPILLVLGIGLSKSGDISFPPGSPSLAPIADLLGEPAWSLAFTRSIEIAVGAAVGSVLLGGAAAYVSVRRSGRAGTALGLLVLAPAVTPPVVYALGLVLAQPSTGLPTTTTLTLSHAVISTPFSFLVLRVGLLALPRSMAEASRLLGAGRLRTLAFVVLPMMLPYITVAAALAMSVSFAEPILALFLATDESATLPQKSFEGLRFAFSPLIFTAASLLILVTLAVAALTGVLWRLSRGRG